MNPIAFAARLPSGPMEIDAMHDSVFKASPRRQGGGGSPYLRSRLSPPRRRLGDKAVVDRLASPYRFKNIDA